MKEYLFNFDHILCTVQQFHKNIENQNGISALASFLTFHPSFTHARSNSFSICSQNESGDMGDLSMGIQSCLKTKHTPKPKQQQQQQSREFLNSVRSFATAIRKETKTTINRSLTLRYILIFQLL